MTRTAVVGAGLCGLLVGRSLQEAGHQVEVFDKGRGPGGRMGTRRWDREDPNSPTFDHGAVCCIPEAPAFRQQVQEWVEAGWMARWEPRTPGPVAPRYVALPTWGTLARHLAQPLNVAVAHRVRSIAGSPGDWSLSMESGKTVGPFEQVLVTVPGPQAAELLSPVSADLASAASAIRTTRCWTGMLRFPKALSVPYDLIEDSSHDATVRTAAAESSRPGRPDLPCWTVQAGPAWSNANWDEEPQAVATKLESALAGALGLDLPRCVESRAHRWGFAACGVEPGDAATSGQAAEAYLDRGLGLAGDGLGAAPSGLESAWCSAQQMVQLTLNSPCPKRI